MAKSRSTFGKMQREQEKRSRAKEKQERKELRKTEEPDELTEPSAPVDQGKILLELAKIHEDLDEGRLSFEDFEVRQEELRELLMSE
ncbi:MAG: hypothetical protein WCI12_05890 [Actinomycetes bacterium]